MSYTALTTSSPTFEPNWVGLAREYGAMSTYRQVDHPAQTECYYLSNTDRTYSELILRDTPVIYWKMGLQTGSGATRAWVDASVNAVNSDTFDGGPSDTIDSAIYDTTLTGAYNDPAGGGDDWECNTSNSVVACSFPFTMECWFHTLSSRSHGQLLALIGDSDYRITVINNNNGRPSIAIDGSVINGWEERANCTSTEPNRSFSNVKFHDGTQKIGKTAYFADGQAGTDHWHHIVAVFTSDASTLYIDGQKYSVAGSHSATAPSASSTTPTFKVATTSSGEGYGSYKGYVCDAALYNYALTTDQIVRHHNAGMKFDRLQLGTAGGSSAYGSGVIVADSWAEDLPGPKVRWGDPHAQKIILTPSAMDATETLKAVGDGFARPEKQLARESAGGFALVCGVRPTIDISSEDKIRTLYDTRISAVATSCTGTDTSEHTWSNGVMVGIDPDGFPICKWVTDGDGISASEQTLTATTAIADGEFAWLSCVIIPDTGSANNSTVYLMKNHEVVGTATSQNDLCKEINRVKNPEIGFPVGSDTSPGSENWQGDLGPLMVFYNNTMTTEKVSHLIKAAEGSNWTSRSRKNPHRITRPQRYYSSGRV